MIIPSRHQIFRYTYADYKVNSENHTRSVNHANESSFFMKDSSIFETYVDLHYVTKVTFLGKAKNATLGNKRNNFLYARSF